MKKILIVLLAVAVLAAAGIALAGVSGTPHDPRVANASVNFVCESCHSPHSGSGAYPLWNRNRAHEATAFNMYVSPSQDMVTSTDNLGYQSRLCFACHDGAVSTIVYAPGTDTADDYIIDINGSAAIDTNLTNDHPVGFVFNAADDTGSSNIPAVLDAVFPLFTVGASNDTFQCSTCHSVHHTGGYDPSATNDVYFLRTSNAGSAMCALCHPAYY